MHDTQEFYSHLASAAHRLRLRHDHHLQFHHQLAHVRKLSLDKNVRKKDVDHGIKELKQKIDELLDTERGLFKHGLTNDQGNHEFAEQLHALEIKLESMMPVNKPTVKHLEQRISSLEKKHEELQNQGLSKERLDKLREHIARIKERIQASHIPKEPRRVFITKDPDPAKHQLKTEQNMTSEPIKKTIERSISDYIIETAPETPPLPVVPPFMKTSQPPIILPPPKIRKKGKTAIPRLRPPGPLPKIDEEEFMKKHILTAKGTQEADTNPDKPHGMFWKLGHKSTDPSP
ncbi:MAG: hypothetical protein ABIH34_03645 [Nanoarchaeota archaeon]